MLLPLKQAKRWLYKVKLYTFDPRFKLDSMTRSMKIEPIQEGKSL